MYIGVRLAARNPFASLKSPVVGIRQNYIHKNIVVSRGVETRNIKTEEREHAPIKKEREKKKKGKKERKPPAATGTRGGSSPLCFILTAPGSDREIKKSKETPSPKRRAFRGEGARAAGAGTRGAAGRAAPAPAPALAPAGTGAPGAGAPATGGSPGAAEAPGGSPGPGEGPRGGLPALLRDYHLRLVPVEFQPEWPVAQVDLSLAGN